jgi:hypothetical protein
MSGLDIVTRLWMGQEGCLCKRMIQIRGGMGQSTYSTSHHHAPTPSPQSLVWLTRLLQGLPFSSVVASYMSKGQLGMNSLKTTAVSCGSIMGAGY